MAENFKVKCNFGDHGLWEKIVQVEKCGSQFFAEFELKDEEWDEEEETKEREDGVIKLTADNEDDLIDQIIDKLEEHCSSVDYWVYVANNNGGMLVMSMMY